MPAGVPAEDRAGYERRYREIVGQGLAANPVVERAPEQGRGRVKQSAATNLLLRAVRMQIASAIHLIVHIERMRDGIRRVQSITEVTGIETDIVTLQDIFVFEKRGLSPHGRVIGRFGATGILPKFNDKLIAAGCRLPVGMFDEIVAVGAV